MYEDPVNHKFHRWLRAAVDYEADWREENEIAFDYYDGVQWTEEESSILKDRGQQAFVLNVTRAVIDMVMAMENDRKVDVLVEGREASDDAMARLQTELVKQNADVNDLGFEQSQCFRDAIIGGRGWLQAMVKPDAKGVMQVKANHVPWEDVYPDPFHKKSDASDGRYIIKRVWMDRDIAEEKWPEKAKLIQSIFTDYNYEGHEYQAQMKAGNNRAVIYWDAKSGRVAVYECQYRDIKGKIRVVTFADNIFLEGSPEGGPLSPYDCDTFTLVSAYGFRRHTGEPRGLVSYIRDCQDMLNKENSKYLWNISANRVVAEEGAMKDPDQVRSEMNRPDGMIILEDGGLGKIRTEDSMRESSQLMAHMQFLLVMIQRISGVNDSMLGLGGTNERSFAQQQQRITQGTAMQTQLFENLMYSRKSITRVIIHLMAQYYTDQRVIRITEPNGQKTYYTVNEKVVGEDGKTTMRNQIGDALDYDLIVKEVPAFNSTRQYSMQVFSEVAKTGVLPPEIVGRVLIEMSDMPNKQDILFQLEGLLNQQKQMMAAQAQAGAGM